ncbi:MAG: GAF domain-containing protein [Syntrophobacterales bacterium]|nr:GAF domain-containing protein [Syntrophobacterales bacterium]
MKLAGYIRGLFTEGRGLYSWMNIIFALFFIFPVAGFIAFGIRYEIMTDKYVLLFFVFFLIFSLIGFTLLRRIFDRVGRISREVSEKATSEFFIDQPQGGSDEISNIVKTFGTLENQFGITFGQLQQKVSEMAVFKELSDLCYVTFDTEEILYVTLERALKLVKADVGSVLILEYPHRKSFVVKATIGLGEQLKLGDRVDFADSIAKYAVINKSPLIVEDIETDSRFGRKSRQQYGTKSFICMPFKTIRDIVGVFTISRKNDDIPFTSEDTDILGPLLSSAAFTYENLRLLRERNESTGHLDSIQKIVQAINSSLKGGELLHVILDEMQSALSFNLAIILVEDDTRPNNIRILDFMAAEPVHLSKDVYYPYQGSIFDKVLKQGVVLIEEDTSRLVYESEKNILAGNKSCVLVPLKTGGGVLGILALCADEPDSFYALQELIERMADTLSLAMERNRLGDYVDKRDQELDTLKQIGSALASSTFDIKQVLKYTMDMIKAVMNVEAGAVLFMREDGLEFTVALNIDMETLQGIRIKTGQGVAGYVAVRGNAVIVNDIEKSSLFYPDVDEIVGFHTKAILCVPMISQGKIMGVIEVFNKMEGDFNAGDKQLLQSIASSVSVAIENANLYNETVSMAENEREIRNIFQKFVPKEIVDKIVYGTETEQLEVEEFRMLTLINIDIRGFSLLAQKIGPQKTVLMLNHFFSIMGGIVFKHHGIVDKYLGDGFLAIFGAPVSSIMDADNAVAAAIEMRESIAEVNDYCLKEIGNSVDVGISVHTGEVVVGNIGFDKKMDYTVIGDSVNIVFKLQALTKSYPNSILISEKTLSAVKTHLDVRETDISDSRAMGDLKVYELTGIV